HRLDRRIADREIAEVPRPAGCQTQVDAADVDRVAADADEDRRVVAVLVRDAAEREEAERNVRGVERFDARRERAPVVGLNLRAEARDRAVEREIDGAAAERPEQRVARAEVARPEAALIDA